MRTAEKMCVVLVLAAMLGPLLVAEAAADLTIHYDRAEWEAALTCQAFTEDFESEALGVSLTPYETASGFLLTSTPDPMDVGIYDSGPMDGTRYVHFRNFCGGGICDGLTFAFPDTASQTAFGFDYHVLDDTWELRVAGQVVIIEDNTEGFIGIIDDTGSLLDFLFFCDEYVQNGLSVDNVSYSPVCAPDLTVYHDRVTWEAALGCPACTEDLEAEVPGVYPTPYETADGFVLTSTADPIDVGIYNSGQIDGTRYVHFRNFCGGGICEGMTFTFPGTASQTAFGFDYHVLDDTWELRVAGQVVIIEDNTEGFIGIIADTGSLADFLFFCDEHVQNGLSVDNVSYSCGSPVRQTTWGRLKSLYR